MEETEKLAQEYLRKAREQAERAIELRRKALLSLYAYEYYKTEALIADEQARIYYRCEKLAWLF